MKKLTGLTSMAAIGITLATACGDDDDNGSGRVDAGPDGSTAGAPSGGSGGGGTGGGAGTAGEGGTAGTGGAPDGGPQRLSLCADETGADQIACGEYIVKHVDACGDCHSERLPTGAIDPAFFLAGNAAFADLDPGNPAVGLVPAPNLTQLAAEGWTAGDVKNAFQNGERPDNRGGGLFPIMPYFVFHNMAPADADAVAAYILSLTPITHAIPTRQSLPAPFSSIPLPVPAFPATAIPDTTLPATDAHYADAQLGKYLAAEAGICMECHTPRTPQGALDTAKLFAGGEGFEIGPPFGTVLSRNITPHASGIAGWTPQNIQTELLQGINKDGKPICPPMPVGPFGAFGGLTPEHALAIGYYITSLPPVENPEDGGVFPMCNFPSPPPDGGGSPDGAVPDGSAPDASPDASMPDSSIPDAAGD
jgi:hypothetical protein